MRNYLPNGAYRILPIHTHHTQPVVYSDELGWQRFHHRLPLYTLGGNKREFSLLQAQGRLKAYQRESMSKSFDIHRLHIVSFLRNPCQESQEAAEGENLLIVNAIVSLMLIGIVTSLGLDNVEHEQVWGLELARGMSPIRNASSN